MRRRLIGFGYQRIGGLLYAVMGKLISNTCWDNYTFCQRFQQVDAQGFNVDAYTWNAIFLPKNAPKPIVDRLNKAAVDAINTPAVKDKLAGLGAEIATGNETTPEYLAKLVKDETEKWAVPIKASGVTVE